jgi:2-keto-4-pentenoate hydratase/2-oxohepta-3-ene-1,7-dioic acid hydratase in catechol pathway
VRGFIKLLRYDAGAGVRLGVLKDDMVADLGLAEPSWDATIAGGPAALDRIATLAERASAQYPLAAVRLLAPVRPGKYLAIGMNYQKHLAEAEKLGIAAPKRQTWFNKQTTCVSGPFDPIDPGVSEKVDYEVELGVVIGQAAKRVAADRAHEHIFGYLVANDVSARDWQFHSPTFTIGKSFDTHGPIGPWIVTADEAPDCHQLPLRCLVNGELRQSSNTSQMIYNVFEQIEYLSTAFTLEPGDLLATGTPEGVGVAMDPPVFLREGDVVRCEVDGVGAIENRVERPRAQ